MRRCAGSQRRPRPDLLPDPDRRHDAAHRRRAGDPRLSIHASATWCRRSGTPESPCTSLIGSAHARHARDPGYRRPRVVSPPRTPRAGRPATLLVLFVCTQVTLGAFVDLVRAAATHQHRARRQRRARAVDVAGADAAQLSQIQFADSARRQHGPRRSALHRTGYARPSRRRANATRMKSTASAVAGRAARDRRPRRARQAAAEPARRGLGCGRLRHGQRRHARRLAAPVHDRRHGSRRRRRIRVQPGHRARARLR